MSPLSDALAESPTSRFFLNYGNGNNAQLTGTGSDTGYYALLFVVPIVVGIVLLDFAIFGAFASRSSGLNPVSRFFYQAREGLAKVRRSGFGSDRRRRRKHQQQHRFQSPARPEPNRVAR